MKDKWEAKLVKVDTSEGIDGILLTANDELLSALDAPSPAPDNQMISLFIESATSLFKDIQTSLKISRDDNMQIRAEVVLYEDAPILRIP